MHPKASGAHGRWGFRPDCGTQLFWDRDGSDEIDAFAGTLDEMSLFAVPQQ